MNVINIVKGNSFNFDVTVKDINGVIFDLTGYTMTFMAKSSHSITDDNAEITKTATITTPEEGVGFFEFSPSETNISVKGTYMIFK